MVSQPKPSSDKSPYFDLARKHNLELTFHQFINVEGVSGKDFKKSGLNINDYNGIILLSRNAVDHFFRVCDEVKYKVPQNLRYFCASEAIALYLQKFILYRKRKVAFSPDGSTEGLLEVIMKFKDECTLMLPVSERTKNEIAPLMKANDINFQEAALYRIAGNDLTKFNATDYDAILLFSPFGVDVVMDDMKEIASKKIRVATYGTSTAEAAKVAGLNIMLEAPTPLAPSMITAIDLYIKKNFPQ